jgi:hypothetical protein
LVVVFINVCALLSKDYITAENFIDWDWDGRFVLVTILFLLVTTSLL